MTNQENNEDNQKDIFSFSLKDFLKESEDSIRRKSSNQKTGEREKRDELGFFEIAEQEIKENTILLVQGIWGCGKSTFLKFLFWQKKNQIEEQRKTFIPVMFTPWFFDKHDFYSEFFGLLKSALLQHRYSEKLDSSIEKLLETLYNSDSLLVKITGLLMQGSKKSLDEEINNIADIIRKDYNNCHIMLGIDEIDRLHQDDLIEVGKLLELINLLFDRLNSNENNKTRINVIFSRSNHYLSKIIIPGGIDKGGNEYSFDQYFNRFWKRKIDIYYLTLEELKLYFNSLLRDVGILESVDVKQLESVLYKKDIYFTIRSIKQLFGTLKLKLELFRSNIDKYNELDIFDILNKHYLVFIYLFFVLQFKENEYRDLFYSDWDKEKEIINGIKIDHQTWLIIHSVFTSGDPFSLLQRTKLEYYKKYIIDVINNSSSLDITTKANEAKDNFLKYKNDIQAGDLARLFTNKISQDTMGRTVIKKCAEQFLLAIIDEFVQLKIQGSRYENVYHGEIGSDLVYSVAETISLYIEGQYDATYDQFLLPLMNKIKDHVMINHIAKMIILLPFWWYTWESYSANDYRKIINRTLDKKIDALPIIEIKKVSFNLQATSSSSLFLGYQVLQQLAEGFNVSDNNYLDEYIKENMKNLYSADDKQILQYIRYILELFRPEKGVFENLEGFIGLFSNDGKIKIMIRMFGYNGFDKNIMFLGENSGDRDFNKSVALIVKQQIEEKEFDLYRMKLESIYLLNREQKSLMGHQFDEIKKLINELPEKRKI